MDPPHADECLRNIAQLVRPDGHLFGIDLNVRTKVASDLGWEPAHELLEEIHGGDPSLRNSWPWGYWGLELLNKKRDWQVHYASVFGFRVGLWWLGFLFFNLRWNPERRIDFVDLLGTSPRRESTEQTAGIIVFPKTHSPCSLSVSDV